MSDSVFHPLVEQWFASRFEAPTEPQRLGWPLIASGRHTLIAAPTGSGKTLTAFLSVIDRLLREALAGTLEESLRVVYVSPLRALSNDMHRNLEVPLAEITELVQSTQRTQAECTRAAGDTAFVPIRAGLRTGDTSPYRRAQLLKSPPHILVTTPESLYLLLTSEKGRERLATVETVIVDEIHALVRDKRGSHLALSLERLAALCPRPLQRIGLSATQKPIERMAEFLVGAGTTAVIEQHEEAAGDSNSAKRPMTDERSASHCRVVDVGHARALDLAIEVPASELGAVCMHEQWAEVNARLVELIESHRSTLIFVNTRRMAERVTHRLSELLGDDAVGSHHGSLSADIRHSTEQRLKSGALKAVVATASLELGLDIGYIDLVVQLGSPRSIATFLQRIGRSGHSLGLVPKGRLFALTRDELLEAMALMRAIHQGRLDAVPIPESPLDVLAQQIVAECACRDWGTDALFDTFRRAWPYRHLQRDDFDQTIEFLSEGIATGRGRGLAYLHQDRVGRRLRARRGARIAAVTNAGAIPEIGSYRVVAEPEHTVVGTLDEDFAIESHGGQIFLLGNTSWRIQHVRGGDVTVTDAGGAPPTIPFWRGEAPGRTWELSAELSQLREEIEQRLDDADAATGWLAAETNCSEEVARQAVEYAAAQKAAIGLLPTQRRVVFERFFDETGGMQLVVHAPFGSKVNHAWGLAMRKRFCRSFDFELQATADDDGFILSLGPQHSFPIESLFGMLTADNVRALLEQAILAVPMFQIRWRWNANRALQVLRMRNGKKVPPALQRFRADDLLTSVFPTVTGCLENIVGDIELPDHPLTRQTMHDCLREALDFDGLRHVLQEIGAGTIELVARDTREPSPFSYELLNSNPYAFLDGGEIQERRVRAVSTRRSLTVESVSDLGRLDPEAIERVRAEAQPLVRSADELHDALLSRVVMPLAELSDVQAWFDELLQNGRATVLTLQDDAANRRMAAATERLPAARAMFPQGSIAPPVQVPAGVQTSWSEIEARVAAVRGLIEICGPVTAAKVAEVCAISPSQADAALEALEGEGLVLRGRFTPGENSKALSFDETIAADLPVEWCHRRLLARIHRLTLEGLRKQIEPVSVDDFMRFLTRHHGLLPHHRRSGANGLYETISLLQGLDLPAVSWERDILAARLDDYRTAWLDELCLTGEVGWGRLFPPRRDLERSPAAAVMTRVVPVSLFLRSDLPWLSASRPSGEEAPVSGSAEEVRGLLEQRGAMFASDLLANIQMLPTQLDGLLGELVARGLVTADGFSGLRHLIGSKGSSDSGTSRRRSRGAEGIVRRRAVLRGPGRWSLWRRSWPSETGGEVSSSAGAGASNEIGIDAVEQWAWQLLRRWGVIFRDLWVREDGAPSWYELLRVYRRLEARGEIRGGRFVAGVAGEQFALGSSVRQLRSVRDQKPTSEIVVISAVDPLNLTGIITPGPRVAGIAGHRLAYANGRPVAVVQAGELKWLDDVAGELRTRIERQLGGSPRTVTAPSEKASALGAEDVNGPGGSDASADAPENEPRPTRRSRKPNGRIPRPMIS